MLLSAFFKLIKNKSDALNQKITLALLNQVVFELPPQVIFAFLFTYLAAVVVYSGSSN